MKWNHQKRHIVLPAVLTACLLLFVLAGGIFYTKFLQAQIYEERTTQLVEITSQVQVNLNTALDNQWNYLTSSVNILRSQMFDTVQDAVTYTGILEEMLELDTDHAKLMLLDDQGNCYDADGIHGVWPDIGMLSGGEDRYTFISDGYDRQSSYWTFTQRLGMPMRTADGSTVFTHAVLLKDVDTFAQYYDSSAYHGYNETYILKSDGTRMHDNAPQDRMIQAYNIVAALEKMEQQGIPDIQAALREKGTVSDSFRQEGREYYYCITSLEKYNTQLLFLIPAEYVAAGSVRMMGTSVRTMLVLVAALAVLLVLAHTAILRQRAGVRLYRKEQENLRHQEELNRQLNETNAMLTEAKEAAEQAFQIAEGANQAKSAFLSNMSHDIRTPMNAVVGFATLLSRDAENPEKVREYTKKITASSQHLLGLINDILDISKIEAGKTVLNLSDENIVDLIEGIDSIIRPQMKAKGHSFEIYSKEIRHEHVTMDKLRLNQILLNLLSNAVKYTPDGGKISLMVQELPQLADQLARYRFVVTDNGYGMTPEYVQKIFHAFTREEDSVTNKIQGTGLGMAITKNLIDLMGGKILVESEKGKGSKFTVDLDLHVSEYAADGSFWKNHGITRLLAVDDEEVICQNIQMAMENTGVAVDYALDGQTAVDMAGRSEQAGQPYSVVLLDWKMPGMDGVETAKKIRREVSDIPVLILTSYDWTEIEDAAREAGVDAFLPKPFFLTSFRQKIDMALNRTSEETEEDADNGQNSLKGMHILVAEDNEINSEILREILDIAGATCDICENGAQVVETFEKSEEGQYQLILMDVQMPVMNGYEATRAIRRLSHPLAGSVPIIAMTANAFAEDIRDALDSGMNAHVAKPVDMAVLEQTVRAVMGY